MKFALINKETNHLEVIEDAPIFLASAIKPMVRGALETTKDKFVVIEDGILYILNTTMKNGVPTHERIVSVIVALESVLVYPA